VPDVDGLSLLFGAEAYVKYHHVLTHGIVSALIVTAVCAALARDRVKVALLSFAAFHLHLACDLVGSGAGGQPWPIVYLWPFSSHETMFFHGWDLASPQNAIVWLAAVAATIWIGVRHGRTFVEVFLPARGDAAVVATLRKYFSRAPVSAE
jgi:hypothetical protein